MTINAVPDPRAWTLYIGSGSNQTLLGRVTIINNIFAFTPDPSATIPAATMRLIADKLDALNTP